MPRHETVGSHGWSHGTPSPCSENDCGTGTVQTSVIRRCVIRRSFCSVGLRRTGRRRRRGETKIKTFRSSRRLPNDSTNPRYYGGGCLPGSCPRWTSGFRAIPLCGKLPSRSATTAAHCVGYPAWATATMERSTRNAKCRDFSRSRWILRNMCGTADRWPDTSASTRSGTGGATKEKR